MITSLLFLPVHHPIVRAGRTCQFEEGKQTSLKQVQTNNEVSMAVKTKHLYCFLFLFVPLSTTGLLIKSYNTLITLITQPLSLSDCSQGTGWKTAARYGAESLNIIGKRHWTLVPRITEYGIPLNFSSIKKNHDSIKEALAYCPLVIFNTFPYYNFFYMLMWLLSVYLTFDLVITHLICCSPLICWSNFWSVELIFDLLL